MQITVFGASGKVGHLVVEEAHRRGHTVVAFIHNRNLFVPNNRLIIVKGDIHNAADVEKALNNSEAAISCLGSWGTKSHDVVSTAVRALIPAMEQQGIKRIITLTGAGAKLNLDKPAGPGHRLFMSLISPLPAGKVFRDGEEHMRLLAASGLDWTIIRSPVMNNIGGAGYTLSTKVGSPLATVSRQSVATAILDQLENTDTIHAAPIIHRR
jgi:putative NADH-flavin reductase